MMFKKALWIPVFIYTEDELGLKGVIDLPENAGLSETELRPFWSIDSAFKDSSVPEFTVFYSSSDTFTTPINLKEFTEKVDKHIYECNI